jgi:AcrR family transcriptional regulator
MTRRKARKRTRLNPDELREHILEAFSSKAKRTGIRSVMMGELAAELRMSATTLYKQFPSKEALTLACVDRWVDELGAAEAARPDPKVPRDAFAQFMHWVDAWADANATLSPAFARDLQSDYPVAWRRYRDAVRQRRERGAELLRPVLKPELDQRVALSVLYLILTTVLEPEFADRLRISRHEAIRSAVSIWAGGAVDRRGEVRAIRNGKKS